MFGQFVSVSPCPTCGGEGEIIKEGCEVCRGDGRVRADRSVTVEIPPGVSSNNYLTLRGQGPAGVRGGPAGDLIVMLEVKDDERFERQGDDLVWSSCRCRSRRRHLGPSSGCRPRRTRRSSSFPPGTQSGTVMRLKGKGLPRLGQGGTGDLARARACVDARRPDR